MKPNYEVDNVMKYFYEISKIPRKSGNEENVCMKNYWINFLYMIIWKK